VLIVAQADNYQTVLANPLSKRNVPDESTGIYDIEKFRDAAMCGYYISSPNAPSYLQRFFHDAYQMNSSDFGIETFVIGEYVPEKYFDKYSNVDREFFRDVVYAEHIRGMPGCKNYESCSDNPLTGRFGLTTNSTQNYGATEIDCAEGARCES
jgi:hypothetical protein